MGYHPVGVVQGQRGSRWNLHSRKLHVEIIKGHKQNRLAVLDIKGQPERKEPATVQKASFL